MSDYDWAADQGDKWLANLIGLEAMMHQIDAPLLSELSELTQLTSGDGPMRIADIASGGGGTTFAIESIALPNAVIHGYDISNALVESANQRAKKQGSHVAFKTANMQIKAAPIEKYDYLVSRFGIMFFDDPSAAFRNIYKWLTPNGRFAFAVWGNPKLNPWMSSIRKVIDRYIELPKPEHDAPGPFRYANIDGLLAVLSASGFKDVKLDDWRGKVPLSGGLNANESVDFALNQFSMSEPLKEAGGSVFDEAKNTLIDTLKPFEVDGVVSMDAYVHIVTGSV